MIQSIVTDIEGTTSSLSFVKDILFPYSRKNLESFIISHQHEPQLKECIEQINQIAGKHLSTTQVISQLLTWIDQDKKITPLKSIQGLIWEDGYEKGDFFGHIYQDAYNNLIDWNNNGIKLYVYSSGSVHAQKLLFSHTEYGNISNLFSGFFDTRVGHKKDPQSYRAIAETIEQNPIDILFLSDITEELDAARFTGYHTKLLDRENEIQNSTHPKVISFNEIDLNHININ